MNEKFAKYLAYCENSPSGLVWIKKKSSKTVIGDVAGSKSTYGNGKPKCWDLRFNNKLFKVHRVIWEIVNGEISPSLVINHIDCNPFNNKIDNLELVDQKTNSRRCSAHTKIRLQTNNKTGINGVSFITLDNVNIGYIAFWRELDGSIKNKRFTFSDYGDELALILAKTTRDYQISKLNQQGAGYAVAE